MLLVVDGRAREVTVPGVTGRAVQEILVSRDGSRLVAVLRGRKVDRVLASRIQHDDTGRVLSLTTPQVLSLPDEGAARIRDVGWRSPTTVSVLSDISDDFSQVRTFSVDGSPGGDRHVPPPRAYPHPGVGSAGGQCRVRPRGAQRHRPDAPRAHRPRPAARAHRPHLRRLTPSPQIARPRLWPTPGRRCGEGVMDEALDLFLGSSCVGCCPARTDAVCRAAAPDCRPGPRSPGPAHPRGPGDALGHRGVRRCCP